VRHLRKYHRVLLSSASQEASPEGEVSLYANPYPFPVGARVKGSNVRGVLERYRAPFTLEVRQDRDKRIIVTPHLGIELDLEPMS
jgi:hypothetical protein